MDINCDLGEGMENDAQIMPFLSSCNIACGGHSGDAGTMKNTVLLSKKYGVKVGAHPSFPDRKNFGRKKMDLPMDVLRNSLIKQISNLKQVAKNEGVVIHHIKPHGALYNLAFDNEEIAEVLIEVMQFFDKNWFLYVPLGSIIAQKAMAENIPFKYEAFAERNYNDDLTLVDRNQPNAILYDISEISKRVQLMFEKKVVLSINKKIIPYQADTICVHGDHPNAIQIAKTLSNLIKKPIGNL
jgi:UPF0271 protein